MTNASHLRLGLWQAPGTPGDVAANLAEIAKVARGAAGETDLLIFPECFLTGYYTADPIAPVAAQVTPARLTALAELSAETGVGLIVGSYEPREGAIHNSALVFTPQDGHLGSYRKQMLFGAWETQVFRAGAQPYVFAFNGFRIGVLICYDIEFPERARALGRQGVDLIATPTALMVPFSVVPNVLVPARAIENHCYVAYCNRIGADAAHRYLGHSRIVDPEGRCLAPPDATRRLISATLDLAACQAARAEFRYLDDLTAMG